MPTYQYKCLTCNKVFDKLHIPIEERDEQSCEDCGQQTERQIVVGNVSVWAPTAGGFR